MTTEQAEGPRVNTQRAEPARARTNGVGAGVEAATRLPIWMVANARDVLDDAPERSGSENRHDDVRESESQDSHSQVVASELGRPWSPRVEGR